MIYHELSKELGVSPQPPLAAWALQVDDRVGENDHLIVRSDNGLRPADELLPQPSQEPSAEY